jgi:hypothetical protein
MKEDESPEIKAYKNWSKTCQEGISYDHSQRQLRGSHMQNCSTSWKKNFTKNMKHSLHVTRHIREFGIKKQHVHTLMINSTYNITERERWCHVTSSPTFMLDAEICPLPIAEKFCLQKNTHLKIQ